MTVGAMSFAVVSEPDATPDEIAVVSDGLHRFNVAATGPLADIAAPELPLHVQLVTVRLATRSLYTARPLLP